MNAPRHSFSLALLIALFSECALAQNNLPFDLQAYEAFLSGHVDMSSTQLLALHPAGVFAAKSQVAPEAINGLLSIDSSFAFTSCERSLIADHGFMVSDRFRYPSFGDAVLDVYRRDLPVFVSADAILHAVHASYDAILRGEESGLLAPDLDALLSGLRAQLPAMSAEYAAVPAMAPMLHDLDIYLTVAYALLSGSASPYFPEDAADVNSLESLIAALQAAPYPLFSSTPRNIDFSQFTIRGHYTLTVQLGRYFQSMTWLGRTELYLLGPAGVYPPQTTADIQRQTIDAALLVEAMDRAGAFPRLGEIDTVISSCVGESDNVTVPDMKSLLQSVNIGNAGQLLDTTVLAAFQDTLRSRPFAFQRINSQILVSDNPMIPGEIQPAASVLLLGQRFVIDAYVTGNVVYDKIKYKGSAVWRGLSSTLDVLFALGNDAAAQLLVTELDTYHYASNLAAIRYLIDGYDSSFWESSIFNAWLGMIRACNPPAERSALPGFMTTASWWQEKMNTQLASWAELRHDNLLYAKQSYTGVAGCSFPGGYVEPIPALYDAVRALAQVGKTRLVPLLPSSYSLNQYFSQLDNVADTLGTIAREELNGGCLTVDQIGFLKHMLYMTDGGCVAAPDGWYFRLFYLGADPLKQDFLVADVHTCPADASGNPVGWVLHVGTGPVNLAVVTAPSADGGPSAYVGPVMSYGEHVTDNFLRLTDAQWSTSYALYGSSRPSFVNLYIADSTGGPRGAGVSLLTGISTGDPVSIPRVAILYQNYPNPFNPSTLIRYAIPGRSDVTLSVYNTLGQRVASLVHETQDQGYYQVSFEGGNLSSGVYFYRLQAGSSVTTKRMIFLK